MTDDQTPGSIGGSVARPPGVIFGACILLAIVGLGATMLSLPGVFDPAGSRCHLSRTWLADAITDNKDWNNVDIGAPADAAPDELRRQAKALACPDAIRLAGQIPLRENSDKTIAIPSDTVVLVQSGLAVVMGIGQALSGWVLLRRLSRQARAMAIGFSAAGLVLRILGIISLGVFVFVVYALAFSAASREIWPKEPREPR